MLIVRSSCRTFIDVESFMFIGVYVQGVHVMMDIYYSLMAWVSWVQTLFTDLWLTRVQSCLKLLGIINNLECPFVITGGNHLSSGEYVGVGPNPNNELWKGFCKKENISYNYLFLWYTKHIFIQYFYCYQKLYKSELTGSFVLVPVICATWVSIIMTEMQVNIVLYTCSIVSLRFQLPSSEDIWLVWNKFVVFIHLHVGVFIPLQNQSSTKRVLRFVRLCQPFQWWRIRVGTY